MQAQGTHTLTALVLLAAVATCVRARITVLGGPRDGLEIAHADAFRTSVPDYDVTGFVVPYTLTGGCLIDDGQPLGVSPNISFIVLDDAFRAGCQSIADIVVNNAASVNASLWVFTQGAFYQAVPGGLRDPVGDRTRYMYMGLAITLLYPGQAQSDFVALVQNGTLRIHAVADPGPYAASLASPLYVGGRIVAFILFGLLALYCWTAIGIVLVRRWRKFALNTSNQLFILVGLFATLRFIEAIDYQGLLFLLGSGGQAAVLWIAYIFALWALLELLHGWTTALVKSRDLPQWLLTAYRAFAVVTGVVIVLACVSVVIYSSEKSFNAVARMHRVMYYIVGACLGVIGVVYVVAGSWLLAILGRTGVTDAKTVIMKKITVLMVVAAVSLLVLLIVVVANIFATLTPENQLAVALLNTLVIASFAAAMLASLRFDFYERSTSTEASGGSASKTSQTGAARLVSRGARKGSTAAGGGDDDGDISLGSLSPTAAELLQHSASASSVARSDVTQ